MRDLLEALKAHVGAMLGQVGQPRHGVVVGYDATRMLAKVQYHPDDAPSGWLPIKMQNCGNGWGIVSGLVPGQQVFVVPDCGDSEHGVIAGATFNAQAAPPSVPSLPAGASTPIQSGETALVHASGQVLRLCADGSIYSRGAWRHEGTFDVTGAITATGNVTAKQGGAFVELLRHTHPYFPGTGTAVQTGGAQANT